VSVEELSVEGFLPFGTFAGHLNPDTARLGEPPVEFFRDMLQLNLGAGQSIASLSTCRLEPRERVIAFSEYHSSTGEVILPLDGDILIHVAPATGPQAGVPVDEIRVFRVPQGTALSLHPGVWHWAPFAVSDAPANVLIVLPERTYANDCVLVEHKPKDQIQIVGD
jgi:ureidoglycolate lyase